tara:strand:- start:607 stop:1194 length:588 start_codon:yes stop_codon:yes gene_type:complete
MINNFKKNEGFTLAETLVNLLIVSVVTVSMFMVFFEIKRHSELEYNKEEIRDYLNLNLDLLVEDLRSTETLTTRKSTISSGGSRTRIQTSNSQFIFDTQNGITKNDSAYYAYIPEDPEDGTEKFKIESFEINDVPVTLGVSLSTEAQNARNASREIKMSALLYTKENQSVPYDTLRFTRRVFCPGLLISEINENS